MEENNQSRVNVEPGKVAKPRIFPAVLISSLISFLITSLLVGILAISLIFYINSKNSSNNLEKQREVVSSEGEVIADVAEKVGPSVVSVVTKQNLTRQDLFFGPRTQIASGAGTGVIIDESGLILTNKHVVPEGITSVSVVTSDGTSYTDVSVVGRDPLNDLAFLKVNNPKNFKAAPLGDSDAMRIGQKVIAIGNALGEFQNSVTSGIISGTGRPVTAGSQGSNETETLSNLFQTDAAINSGNSGGPLLNLSGEVIGINTAVASEAENIGFAIPINEVKPLIESIKSTGKLSRPYLGVNYVMLNQSIASQLDISQTEGAYIGSNGVVASSPAAKAGLKSGDIIIKINETKLDNDNLLTSVVGQFKAGETVELTVIRDGKEIKLSATLGEATKANL